METTPSTPQHLLSSLESSIRTAVTIMFLLLNVVAAMTVPLTLPVTTRFPTAAVDHPADDFFFNVVQQSDNCDRLTHLGRVVIFTANFLDEDFFISLSKWSTHRVGIAQLTQCCVFSRSSLREAHLRWPSLRVRGVPGKKAVSASQRASRPRLPLECSHGH